MHAAENEKELSLGFERSYAGLWTQLRNIIKSEHSIWKNLKGGWYLLYFIQLPLILTLFIPLAVITAILWPLGPLRTPVTVGIVMALMIPPFQLAMASILTKTEEVNLSMKFLNQDEIGIAGLEVKITGWEGDKLITDPNGEIRFQTFITHTRFPSIFPSNTGCPSHALKQSFRFWVVDPSLARKDTTVLRNFEYGENTFSSSLKPLEIDLKPVTISL